VFKTVLFYTSRASNTHVTEVICDGGDDRDGGDCFL